jgi:hypothetical protein
MAARIKPARAAVAASAERGDSIRAVLCAADTVAEVKRLAAEGQPMLRALDAVSSRAGISWGSPAFDALAARCGIYYNRRCDLYLTSAEERCWTR